MAAYSKDFPKNFAKQQLFQVTPLSELPPGVASRLPEFEIKEGWPEPSPIYVIPKKRDDIQYEGSSGHYFAGGLPALMQAVRLLQRDPNARVTFVNDGKLQKSTQSAHQGHVHPTEWATPDLDTFKLMKLLLNSFRLLPATAPDDVVDYSYVHFPFTKIRPLLFLRYFFYRIIHKLFSKHSISSDDRWQCDAVRESLAFHKSLNDEMEQAGFEPTFAYGWRMIWSTDRKALERKQVVWGEAGIATEFMSEAEMRKNSLLRLDVPLFALKIYGDGKFFADVDRRIISYLTKKYPTRFEAYQATVTELYIDEATKEPFAVSEQLADGSHQTVAVDSFFGSTGHNQVFELDKATQRKKPLWTEVPVSGVSTLWVCTVTKADVLRRFADLNLSDEALAKHLTYLVGSSNLTNLHSTVWDAVVDQENVYIIVRATEGANFNSEVADPNDLLNMKANIDRFFIGSWQLITAGTCIRKTEISNLPELKGNFLHSLSGIGFSFSAAPPEMFKRETLTDNLGQKLLAAFKKKFR